MFQSRLALPLIALIIASAFSLSADAQIEKVTLHLDAFLCDNVCTNHIRSVLKFYDSEIEDVKVDYEKHQATLFPKAKKLLDLYDVRKELRNAGNAPWKIEVTVTGEVVDYTKVYSGGHTHSRKALEIKETGQRFLLKESKELDKLLEAGNKKVTISGEIPTFTEKYPPLLVIKMSKEKQAKNPCNPCSGEK